jgi:hypothetical protein
MEETFWEDQNFFEVVASQEEEEEEEQVIPDTYLPMKMERTECSETSAYKIQTPGNYPEENIQHTDGRMMYRAL